MAEIVVNKEDLASLRGNTVVVTGEYLNETHHTIINTKA